MPRQARNPGPSAPGTPTREHAGLPSSSSSSDLRFGFPAALSRPASNSSLSDSATLQPQPQPLPAPARHAPQPPCSSALTFTLLGAFLLVSALAMNFSLMCRRDAGSLRVRAAAGAGGGPAARAGAALPPAAPTIHIALTACGNPSPREPEYFGLLALKSLLMARAQSPAARNQSYAFHIVTDVGAEELFGAHKVNFDVQRLVAAEPALLSLHLYPAAAVDAGPAGLGLRQPASVPHTIFKNCAAARLKLPMFIPASVPRVLYLDWDVAVLSDLTQLWGEEFEALEAASPTACLGMALNDPTGLSSKNSYRVAVEEGSGGEGAAPPPQQQQQQSAFPAVGGVNSGVMLWQLARIRERGVSQWWEALLAVVEARVDLAAAEFWSLTRAFPLGDQDILNALLSPARFPHWLHVLPPRYNMCLADALPPATLDAHGIRRTMPSIIHFCGSRLTQEGMREDGHGASVQDKATRALYDYLTAYLVVDARMPEGLPAA
jgi:hypothetical protein